YNSLIYLLVKSSLASSLTLLSILSYDLNNSSTCQLASFILELKLSDHLFVLSFISSRTSWLTSFSIFLQALVWSKLDINLLLLSNDVVSSLTSLNSLRDDIRFVLKSLLSLIPRLSRALICLAVVMCCA